MVVALAIFVAAVVVAVVRAGGSDESAPPEAGAQQSVAVVEQAEAEQSADTPTGEFPFDQSEQAIQQGQQGEQAAPQDPEQVAIPQSDPSDNPPAAQQALAPSDPLLGFLMPLPGACVSAFEGHLPNAPRAYRNNGIHEGLDFYTEAACVPVDRTTPVLAAKAGVVLRADRAYVDLTPEDWARFEQANFAGEEILDELRGRQVWIDHGQGIVTRYAHLSAIAAPIFEGVNVRAGQVIGFVGESGQRESFATPGSDLHLHFEIRINEGWLGQGLEPLAARLLYLYSFGLADQ